MVSIASSGSVRPAPRARRPRPRPRGGDRSGRSDRAGRVDAVAADEPDEGRRLDPPGRAWVGLDRQRPSSARIGRVKALPARIRRVGA